MYNFVEICDGRVDCTDASDEFGCPCDENELTCDCIRENSCAPRDGCISKLEVIDGFILCPNKRIPWGGLGRILINRLNNLSECNDLGYPKCDNTTCYNSNFQVCIGDECDSSHVICTSHCDNEKCKGVFQCTDNSLISFSQFCDGIVDCVDGSDEIKNQPGFKCNQCILPQNNLYDDYAHCNTKLDFCFDNNTECFLCWDKRLLISADQVCNGIVDCYDLSDECLCESSLDVEICLSAFDDMRFKCFENEQFESWHNLFNTLNENFLPNSQNPFLKCSTKFKSSINAILCDGRPECKDYRDECQCAIPPAFCNDSCHNLFPMGDRYCDGVEDLVWKIINNSACPQGFDELYCPKRFRCKTTGKVSIDVLQVCDGTADCDDKSDETDCPGASSIQSIFSSDTEMIASTTIKAAFWVIGFLVLFGNSFVIVTSILFLKKKKTLGGSEFHQVIILNISIADFIMGIYLLTIAVHSTIFSGRYGIVDKEWRSSLSCSVIGSLAVISSESSCFLMVVLTAFRLKNIANPFESLALSMRPWKFCIAASWIFSLLISITPILDVASQYFVHSFSFTSSFHNGNWKASKLKQFACRVAALSNVTIEEDGDRFQSVLKFARTNLFDNASVKLFGYYGGTSVCMPRFYVAFGENSWEYSISIITANLFSFAFIAISYILILKQSSQSFRSIRNNPSSEVRKQTVKMQKRIARIIATDFCCWIPICVMAYLRLGVDFSDIVYQISAVLLLPINSAINPFLCTSLPDKLIGWWRCRYQNS